MDETLQNLDPSDRLQVDFIGCESIDQQADRIMHSLRDDLFYLRLKQLAWQQYTQEIEKNPDVPHSRVIKSFLDAQQRRDMLKNVTAKVYERCIVATAGRAAKLATAGKLKRKGGGAPSSSSSSSSAAAAAAASASTAAIPRLSRRSQDETLEHIKQARVSWEQGILEELRAIIYESRRPFLIVREPGAASPWIDATAASALASAAASATGGGGGGGGFDSIGGSGGGGGGGGGSGGPIVGSNTPAGVANGEGVKFLFDSEDLMETILSIRSANVKAMGPSLDRCLGMLKLPLRTPEYPELQARYAELTTPFSQLGCDDVIAAGLGLKLLASRHEECEALLLTGGASIVEARKLLRRGVPPSMRCKLWRVACGLSEKPTPSEEQHFLRLRAECDRMDLLSDELFMHDIQTVLDDPRFFVFEEELKEVILSFSRDALVRSQAVYEVHAPLYQQMGSETAAYLPHAMVAPFATEGHSSSGVGGGSSSSSSSGGGGGGGGGGAPIDSLAAPPCAVQPYLGFATYFAPCAFIFQSKVSLYSVTRFCWCRLWCRLNVMTADDGALLSVCKTFETLLVRAHPRLVMHLLSLGIPPIKVAFPWIQLAFVGFLEMEQLLHLWERVLGFMDVTLLGVAAVAIFVYRAEMLLQCTNEADALMVLLEGSRLHIVPILQAFLMKE